MQVLIAIVFGAISARFLRLPFSTGQGLPGGLPAWSTRACLPGCSGASWLLASGSSRLRAGLHGSMLGISLWNEASMPYYSMCRHWQGLGGQEAPWAPRSTQLLMAGQTRKYPAPTRNQHCRRPRHTSKSSWPTCWRCVIRCGTRSAAGPHKSSGRGRSRSWRRRCNSWRAARRRWKRGSRKLMMPWTDSDTGQASQLRSQIQILLSAVRSAFPDPRHSTKRAPPRCIVSICFRSLCQGLVIG